MARLHETLAVEADLHKTSDAMLADAKNTFAKKPEHFTGQTKSIAFFAEERHGENSSENKAIVTTVDDKLDYALGHFGKYLDAVLQKEATNQKAVADLIIDGVTIAKDVPGIYLLGLEQKLAKLREVLIEIPTLNPAIVWKESPQDGDGVFVSDAVGQNKTEKVLKHKILVEATDKHPAQIEKWNEDVAVAKILTVHRSGMWTPARKAKVLGNLDALIQGAKKARQRANIQEVEDRHISKALFAALLA